MPYLLTDYIREAVALLAEGVDRNYELKDYISPEGKSPSSRRAWIEMWTGPYDDDHHPVALLAEGVDRNAESFQGDGMDWYVALLAEGVDRNRPFGRNPFRVTKVALLAEGVDRNTAAANDGKVTASRPPRGGRG